MQLNVSYRASWARRRDGPCNVPGYLRGSSINAACFTIFPDDLDAIKIGWKPAPTQPQPLERGSAEKRLKDALEHQTH